MPKNLVELVKEEDFDSFLQNNKLVLVKFFTSWCRPCQQLQINIEKLLTEGEKLTVLSVDAEKFPYLTQRIQFNVQSVPALFLFFHGKLVREFRGYLNISDLREFVKL